MDGTLAFGLDRTGLVDRIADHIDDATKTFVTNRHRDRLAGVGDLLPAHKAL